MIYNFRDYPLVSGMVGGLEMTLTLWCPSTGAHSVHQILHHVSRLPEGMRAPFDSAIMQSNAIVSVLLPAL